MSLKSFSYFWGFVEEDVVRSHLRKKEDGTFLFRFGQRSPYFHIYVIHRNVIRVIEFQLCQKKGFGHIFSVGGSQFPSFDAIVSHYSTHPLKVPYTEISFYLKSPLSITEGEIIQDQDGM